MSEPDLDWLLAEPMDASEHNAQILADLHRAVELTEGFALFFACCDHPDERDGLIAALDKLLAAQGQATRRLDVPPPAANLLAGLLALGLSSENGPPEAAAVHICGLEAALAGDGSPALAHLNLARERFRALPWPLLFWLPDAALTCLARGAPDFWAWRSGTFEFWPTAERPTETVRRAGEQIRILENLLAEYAGLRPEPIQERTRAALLLDLSDLYRQSYRPQTARVRLREALPLVRRLNDRSLQTRLRTMWRETGMDDIV